jgi:hypothetical protein
VTGPDDATREQPVVEPTVSTAPPPARAHRWWSVIPHHLGRARTSTVVLGLLFLAVFALYLNVRPDPVATTTTTGGVSEVTEPAPTTGGATTTVPPTTTSPVPTTEVPPTTTPEATTTTESTETSAPPETTETVPAPTETTPAVPAPTTATPTG